MQTVVLGEYDDHHTGVSIISTLLGERTGRAARDISFLLSVQTESDTHPYSYPTGKGSFTCE
jgi:hypothetical protein